MVVHADRGDVEVAAGGVDHDTIVAEAERLFGLNDAELAERGLRRDDILPHVIQVRQTQVFLRRHIAQHRGAVPAGHGGARTRELRPGYRGAPADGDQPGDGRVVRS